MYMWEIPSEKGVTLQGGLELQLRFHLHLKTKERKMWEEASSGKLSGKARSTGNSLLYRFKQIPSPSIRFSCDSVILLFLIQRGRCPYSGEFLYKCKCSSQKGNFYFFCACCFSK